MTAIKHQATQRQYADLNWGDNGTPISVMFDDPYFSLSDGVAETQHVFISGNDLPQRFYPGFHIAELGFGTGLNLAVLASVAPTDCPLRFTSFEAFPITGSAARQAFAALAEDGLDSQVCDQICIAMDTGATRFEVGSITVDLILGDARQKLPKWQAKADAWFLDGFSPAKNPEMWGEDLMTDVSNHTKTGGTFATFTAAGDVRRALTNAGFGVERVAGFGRKRHMTRGVKT